MSTTVAQTEKDKRAKNLLYRKSLKGRGNPLSEIKNQFTILNSTLDYVPSFEKVVEASGKSIVPVDLEILQVNVGYMCNMTCEHCHVDAGPDRKEMMDRETMSHCLRLIDQSNVKMVDLTGGAPEMNHDFQWFVEELSKMNVEIIVRSNLTVLVSNKKYRTYPEFFKKHNVTVIASLPCYSEANVDKQRGDGAFTKSIEALQVLNGLGYGKADSNLKLHLVFNPGGASLPGSQASLQDAYKKKLKADFDIEFNNLYCITNVPISRFLDFLDNSGKLEDYMTLLSNSFNPTAVEAVMCTNTLSVKWDGSIYDCDFNQMLELDIDRKVAGNIKDFTPNMFHDRQIKLHQHCFACTAGAGSSCQGETSCSVG